MKELILLALKKLRTISQKIRKKNNINDRIFLVLPYFDTCYWQNNHQDKINELEPVVEFINSGFGKENNPHPLFDNEYYLAQITNIPPSNTTPLEHYILEGAAASLDPSPYFSTSHYWASYPDIKEAGINPLLHFISVGVHEGREAVDIAEILSHDLPTNDASPYSLAYQAIGKSALKQFKEALKLLRRIKTSLPLPFYLKTIGICFCLANRFPTAEKVFTRLSRIPGVIDSANLYGYGLITAGRIAEARNNLDLAYESYSLAHKLGHKISSHNLTRLAQLYFNQGRELEALDLLAKINRPPQQVEILTMPISSVKDYCLLSGDEYEELAPARYIPHVPLRFLDETPELISQAGSLLAPPFYRAQLSNVIALSKCNIISDKKNIILDNASHPEFLRTQLGDNFSNHEIFLAKSPKAALIQFPTKEPNIIPYGLMMFGVQTQNYGHWFLEFLPRMLAFDRDEFDDKFSIVVDATMPQSHLESLELLNSKKRRIITLPPNEKVYFSALGVAPVPAFFPLDVVGLAYDTIWPGDIFSQLKKKILIGLENSGFSLSKSPRKLFLSRKNYGGSRQLVNEAELEESLFSLGFTTIYPEAMTFSEQVDAFQSASVVVGSCSSALTNAIFCKPGARVVALIHDCLDFNFRGYSSFIEAGGAEIMFVRGVSCPGQSAVHRFHRSYTISTDAFSKAIHWALRK